MADRFLIGRALDRPFAGPLPVHRRRSRQAGLGIVVRDQLRAGLDRIGEVALEQFGDLAVILQARAPEQRLVGGVLDQRMLEDVARTRRPAALIEQFGLDQAAEPLA